MKMDNSLDTLEEIHDILQDIFSIQQPRSNFQLENFVVGQHETEPMQFYQTCLELSEGLFNLRIAQLELKKMKLRYDNILLSDDPIDKIDAEIFLLGIQKTEAVIKASEREIKHLLEIYNSFPHKFTRDEIEEDQARYWKERLNRQALLEQVAVSTSQSEHFNSLRQIGLISVNNGSISWNNRSKEDLTKEIEM